jgi:hypothetical protein
MIPQEGQFLIKRILGVALLKCFGSEGGGDGAARDGRPYKGSSRFRGGPVRLGFMNEICLAGDGVASWSDSQRETVDARRRNPSRGEYADGRVVVSDRDQLTGVWFEWLALASDTRALI